jgi:hypothetical protein
MLKLLDVAEEAVGDPDGRLAHLRASVVWTYGDVGEVPGLLERVMMTTKNTTCLASALGSLGVWYFDRGCVQRALDLNAKALLIKGQTYRERWNRVVWEAMLGNRIDAEINRRSLMSSENGRRHSETYTMSRVHDIVAAIARVLDLPKAVAIRRSTDAFAFLGFRSFNEAGRDRT